MDMVETPAHRGTSSAVEPEVVKEDSSSLNGTKAISRATLILRLIARNEIQGIRLTQLAALTGIPHPTVRRVLKCLIDERLVLQDPTTRRYRLGPLNFELGLATFHKREFLMQFHSVITQIAEACQDTTYLMVRSGADAVCLDRIVGAGPVRAVALEVGGRRPLGFGAAGLALLAQYPDDEVRAILDANAREIEVHKRVTRDRILRGVAHVREHGYSLTRDIASMGFVSIGVVVPAQQERSLFAVSVSSTSERMTAGRIHEVQKKVREGVKTFSGVLHWPF